MSLLQHGAVNETNIVRLFFQVPGGCHKDIKGGTYAGESAIEKLRRTTTMGALRHDNQEIYVVRRLYVPLGGRTKDDDLERVGKLDNTLNQIPDVSMGLGLQHSCDDYRPQAGRYQSPPGPSQTSLFCFNRWEPEVPFH